MLDPTLVAVVLPRWPPAEIALLVAILGASVGSFLNLVAWRLPREESVLWPSSRCNRCGTRLAWYDNIPVLGWLVLRGRCRYCATSLSFRHPAVEALCGGLWVWALVASPDALGLAPARALLIPAGWLFVSLLLVLALIDLDQLWIPEPLCRWGVVAGWLVTALIGLQQSLAVGRQVLLAHALAAALGLLGFETLSGLAARWMGRPALGLGDAKVGALLGAWLGPLGVAIATMLAVVAAAVVGVLAVLIGALHRHQPMPFVPFLALGGALVWLMGAPPWLRVVWGPG